MTTGTFITPKEITTLLKEIGFKNVTMTQDHYQTKTYRDFTGKTVFGLQGGGVGPMTMTSAHLDHNRKKEDILRNKILELSLKYSLAIRSYIPGTGLTVEFDLGKKCQRMVFSWSQFPTYAHNHYDSSYKTFWLICISEKF